MDKVHAPARAGQIMEQETEAADYRKRLHIAAAAVLGISVEELETAFTNGDTIRQIAEARQVDIADIRAALKQVHQEQIREAVDSGELSPGQATIIQRQANFAPWLTENPDFASLKMGS